MDITIKVANQIIIMSIYIAVGYFLTKIKVFNNSNTKPLSVILFNIVTPCVIIDAFQADYSRDIVSNLFIAFIASTVYHIVIIIISKLMNMKNPDTDISVINRYSITYSNCGFMGIPLMQASLGQGGVLIGSAYLAVFNVFMWTQGYFMFNSGRKKLSLKLLFINPGIIGITVALLLFVCKIRIPPVLTSTVEGFASLNTPVAMLLLGSYLAGTDFLTSIKQIRIYIIAFFKLIISPAICIVAFLIYKVDINVSLAIILQAACPCAAAGAIFADMANRDTGYASSLITISTIFSLITLPLVSYISSILL